MSVHNDVASKQFHKSSQPRGSTKDSHHPSAKIKDQKQTFIGSGAGGGFTSSFFFFLHSTATARELTSTMKRRKRKNMPGMGKEDQRSDIKMRVGDQIH